MTNRPKPIKSPQPMPTPKGPFGKVGKTPAEALADAAEELKERPLRILDALRRRSS